MRAIAATVLLTFGALAGTAQTLTCTFQFVGNGTVGTQSFTNANITITTVGFTGNIDDSYLWDGIRILENTSASISISGVGTLGLVAATGTYVSSV